MPFSPACNQTSHRLWKGSWQAEENLCSIQLCWTFMCILPSTSAGLCREKFGSCAACVKIIAICPHRLHCFQVEHQAATLWCVVLLLRERLLISLIVYTKKRGGCIIFNLNQSTNTWLLNSILRNFASADWRFFFSFLFYFRGCILNLFSFVLHASKGLYIFSVFFPTVESF